MKEGKGFHPQHLGVVIEDRIIAPPSQFAFAFIGLESAINLERILNEVIDEVKAEKVDPSQTPLLAHYAKQEEFNLDKLREMATKKTGSQKIINHQALDPNASGHCLSVSKNSLLSARVESRRWRNEQKPYEVSIYDPFDLRKMEFRGGTTFSDKTLRRGQHWGYGLDHEARFLAGLPQLAKERFDAKMEVIDYARAVALTGLHKFIDRNLVNLIGGSYNKDYPEVPLPFDFSDKGKRFAIEAYLLRNAPEKVIREVLEHETGKLTLAEIDDRLLGKKGFVTAHTTTGIHEGYITKGAILHHKQTGNYAWAIVQAMEKHLISEGREFKGYSLEFTGNPNRRTVSIVYDGTEASSGGKDISVRIVLDENFSEPYLLYKNFSPGEYANKWRLLDRDPLDMINLPTDKQDFKRFRTKKWQEVDWRTGKKALCTLREPTSEVINQASEFSRNLMPGRTPYNLRGRYIEAMQDRKFG